MSSDSISRNILINRAMGQYPISVPTSLAIEAALGELPESPSPEVPILQRDLIMVHVRTMIRNMIGSVETDNKTKLTEYTIAEAISNEIRTIETLISEKTDGRCRTLIYHCSYADLLRKFTKAILKSPSTPGQRTYAAMEHTVCKLLEDEFVAGSTIERYNREFPETDSKALLVTHYPIDLLQRYKFAAMSLLESHTGAIKPPMLWNTKLYNGKELEILPFDRMTLQMFGDGVTFTPMNIKVRKRVYNIAVKKQWTPATTKEYVIRCIEENHDPALEVLVKDLYRS